MRCAGQKGGQIGPLDRLADAGLRRLLVDEGLAQHRAQTFDRGDGLVLHGPERRVAGRQRAVADQYMAGAALVGAAAEPGAAQAERVVQHVQQARVGRRVDRVVLAVDVQADGGH